MVFVGVMSRVALEYEQNRDIAEFKRLHLCEWLEQLGVIEELEPSEMALLNTPHGLMDKQAVVIAAEAVEAMLVFAWSLGLSALPPYDHQCEDEELAELLALLSGRSEALLQHPVLRDSAEIDRWRDTYLTIHWRLKEYARSFVLLDLAEIVASPFNWGPLRVADLTLIEGDLAICGRRIDRAVPADFNRTYNIVRDRHKAFNWLLGAAPVYSAVSTDT